MNFKTLALASAALGILAVAPDAKAGATLDAIMEKGFIQCGVSTGLPGFSNPDDAGNWSGLDVDVCNPHAAGRAAHLSAGSC